MLTRVIIRRGFVYNETIWPVKRVFVSFPATHKKSNTYDFFGRRIATEVSSGRGSECPPLGFTIVGMSKIQKGGKMKLL